MATSYQVSVHKWQPQGLLSEPDDIAGETAIALTYNRTSHVVMMATAADLEDFARGFSFTEGIVSDPGEILDIRVLPREQGIEVALTVNEDCFARLRRQRRNLTGRTGCGLCGAESLEQAMRYPAAVDKTISVSSGALQKALASLDRHQPLQQVTGAVHGAAWCGLDGAILALREDVGRHNALDKLIGHLQHRQVPMAAGFLVISSRASYEMIYKAAAAGVEVVVAVSAPTKLAVDFASGSGITLVGFARPGRHNIYTFAERIHEEA
jgi:FdhD protein